MSKTAFILIGITYYVFAIIIVIVVLNILSHREKKNYDTEINSLEREKNLIISAAILSELNKVEALINNDTLKELYDDWMERFKNIKDVEVPRITDELIEIEELHQRKETKLLKEKISKAEMDICYVKTKANYLLDEIKEITLSEERNRETITKLKSTYREVVSKYNNHKEDYKDVAAPLELQFENVDKLFSAFEIAMENNSYTEVGKIVKAIDDTIGNLTLVIEEAPSIILMGKSLIPKKMEDIEKIYSKMEKDGYNLEYLNVRYNIKEAEKKISDIFARLNVLNLEDSIFELKTMLDYFDSIYNDFDKEKISKKIFDDYSRTILIKINKLEKINNDLYRKLDEIKYSYDLTDEDVSIIDEIKKELKELKRDYEATITSHRSKTFAYSRLGKEMELINVRLTKTEEKLEVALRSLGSLKEDELRAREQLDEIKAILRESKDKIRSYKLPVIPKDYYIQLSEATMAIKNMMTELEKKPISIKTLNLRVDTARDLVLKLHNTTKETIKTAKMAETAIVYGNRYRPMNREIDLGLFKAENLFYKGSFKKSLENAITAINIVEPGVYERLLSKYQEESK